MSTIEIQGKILLEGEVDKILVDGKEWGPVGDTPTPPNPDPVPPISNIQDAINNTPAGGTLQIPAGSYPGFKGKNIKMVAAGAVTFTGHADFTRVTDFELNGWQNNTMNIAFAQGMAVNCSYAQRGRILGVKINGPAAPFGDNGSGVALSESAYIVVANSEFRNVKGTTLGSYNWDYITINGNDFIDCNQVISCWTGPPKGNQIQFINNYVDGEGRGGIETGGDNQNFIDFLIQGNQFVNLKGIAKIGPISYVGRPVNRGKILSNYFERGPLYDNGTPEKYSEAIELYGSTIEVTGNTVVDFAKAMNVYPQGTNVNASNNGVFGTPTQAGFAQLASRPARPTRPPRMSV